MTDDTEGVVLATDQFDASHWPYNNDAAPLFRFLRPRERKLAEQRQALAALDPEGDIALENAPRREGNHMTAENAEQGTDTGTQTEKTETEKTERETVEKTSEPEQDGSTDDGQ
jgi:hypothetical protein